MGHFLRPAAPGSSFHVGQSDLEPRESIGHVNESKLNAPHPTGFVVESGLKALETTVREVHSPPLDSFALTANMIVKSQLDTVESVRHDIHGEEKSYVQAGQVFIHTVDKIKTNAANGLVRIGVLNRMKYRKSKGFGRLYGRNGENG